MSGRLDTDILIIGGGMAGLAAAARLSVAGLSVICVEAGPPPSSKTAAHDRRTTAILTPGIETLRASGAWDAMAAAAQPMQGLRILDCGGAAPVPREDALFDAAELGDGPFGWNVENGKARLALADRLDALPNATLLTGTRLAHWHARRDAVLATLEDGTQIRAKLLVGADGRGSAVRESASIGHRRIDYRQKALACRITHAEPHDSLSIEMHHVGGPLTFAPLPGNASGVVWMNPNAEADRLIALDDADFLAELTERSCNVLGEIESLSDRGAFPASSVVATRLTARRTVLIAEAAHAFPPIGAQGFNLSLRDIETLAGLAGEADDPGADTLLSRYASRRLPDIYARTAGVDVLNRSVLSALRPVRDIRRAGLAVLSRTGPLKRLAMRVGMGG